MPLVISAYTKSWNIGGMTASMRLLLSETDSTSVACIVNHCQLQLWGDVTCCPGSDPAHFVVSVRENPEWRRPRERSVFVASISR